MIFYCAVSAFTNAALSLVCGIAVMARDWRNPRNVTYALMALATVVWSGGYFFWQVAETEREALFFCRVLTAGSAVILMAYYHFVRMLLKIGTNRLTVVGYLVAGALVVLSFTDLLVRGVAPKMMFPHWPEPGPLYPAFLVFFMASGLAAIRLLVIAYRHAATPRERNQLLWVWLGTGFGTLGGCTNFFLWYNVPIPPVGNALVGLYIAGVGYAIIRLRLLEVDYALIKLGSYVAAVLPLTGLIVTTHWAVQYVGRTDTQRTALWLISCGCIVIGLFWLVPLLRRRIDSILANTLLKERFERRGELGALARRITSMTDEDTVCRETVGVINSVLDAPAAVYLRGDLEEFLERRAVAGFDGDRVPPRFSLGDPLVETLMERRSPVRFDELDAKADDADSQGRRQALVAFRHTSRAQLAMPVFGDVWFFGFVLVGQHARRRIFTELDVSLLEAVAGHIGLSLRARQLERRANQTEKLISLGTLAAGLAHEMRNPLVSIKTFAALLDENAGDPGFIREFGSTVLRDVGRIESIVENVAAFATDRKVAFGWIRLDEVVRAAWEITQPAFVSAGVKFQMEAADLPTLRGNHNQLTQVVINLLNNAVQAFKGCEGGLVTVRLRHRTNDPLRPSVEMVVVDNGPGIDSEILPRMFEPFTTTKDTGDRGRKGGMGLGLAIVKRIVDGHDGRIQVTSKPGEGTTFTVTLPCVEVSA